MESENLIQEILGDKLLRCENNEIKEVNFNEWYNQFN